MILRTVRLKVPGMDMLSGDRWRSIAAVAREIGATDWQVNKWRVRRSIPGSWHLKLLAAARERGVTLTEAELLSTTNRKVA